MSDIPNIPDLPIYQLTKLLDNSECPFVSVCVPCYLRRKFIPLIMCNLMNMDYPKEKIELNLLQDGPEDLFVTPQELVEFKKALHPIKVQYKYEPNIRRSIGEKRNRLVKSSSHKHIAMLDSDDIYLPTYLRYSLSSLFEAKVGITSSASMIFIYPEDDYKISGIRCGEKRQGHEACCVFTKKHWRAMGGFISKGSTASQGEGVKMIEHNEKKMINLDISLIMICVCHGGAEGNTVNKDQFKDAKLDSELKSLVHVDVVKYIFGDYVAPEPEPEAESINI